MFTIFCVMLVLLAAATTVVPSEEVVVSDPSVRSSERSHVLDPHMADRGHEQILRGGWICMKDLCDPIQRSKHPNLEQQEFMASSQTWATWWWSTAMPGHGTKKECLRPFMF